MSNFEVEYEKLNPQQKKAVDTTEGPLLVVAGPGTGKTQLLAMRVANIIRSTDTDADSILCLTFTNKAAVNMKDRIISITSDSGSKTVVKTFHSLAGEIMNMYPDYFWNSAKLGIIPETVQVETIQNILDELPPDNPLSLKFAGQYTLVSDVQRSIALVKEAGLTADKLRAIIKTNIDYINLIEPELINILSPSLSNKKLDELSAKVDKLPDQLIDELTKPLLSLSSVLKQSLSICIEKDRELGKTTNTSKWKSEWLQSIDGKKSMHKQRERNEWWLKLADVYESYRNDIHMRGYYDYSDMLVEVLSVLDKNPEIRADIQERFHYVLIDEFQDTNPAQLRLAHQIADHPSTEGKPNIMVVGDDDQSIFKFNGALVSSMADFKRSYESNKTVVLTKNYRSSQLIIDASEKIINQAKFRLTDIDSSLNKKLTADNEPEKTSVEISAYQTSELQYSSIAKKIEESFSENKSTAILAYKHESLLKMASVLNQIKVPIRYEKQSNVLDNEIVDTIYQLFRLIEAINNGEKDIINSLFHKVLRQPMWQIEAEYLWEMAMENSKNADWLKTVKQSKNSNVRNFYSWLKAMDSVVGNQPLAIAIEYALGLRVFDQTGSPLKAYYLNDRSKAHEYLASLSAIQLIRSIVHDFSSSDQPKAHDLCRLIEISRSNNKIIADESPYISGENPVNLLTIHKAKGLEFDQVYVIDAVETVWSPGRSGRKPPENLPLKPAGEDMDDFIRLMYVATTRAKSELFISGYKQDHAGKDVSISSIIQSAFDIKNAENNVDLVEVLEQSISWPRLSTGNEKEMLKATLQNYQLSVTHLINFLNLERGGPQYFLERNLLRLPEPKDDRAGFGTAMHAALEYALVQKTSNAKSIFNEFKNTLIKEQLPNKSFQKQLHRGETMINKLFNDFGLSFNSSSTAEQKLNDVKLQNATIRGTIDRIDFNEKGLTVVDYKTGSVINSFYSKDKNIQSKIWQHKLQLSYYNLMIKNSPRYTKYNNHQIVGQMTYLEADKSSKMNITYESSEEELKQLEQLINVVWKLIIDVNLPDTTNYSQDHEGTLEFVNDLLNHKY